MNSVILRRMMVMKTLMMLFVILAILILVLVLIRYNVKVDIDNHLRYTEDEYRLHLTVRTSCSPCYKQLLLCTRFVSSCCILPVVVEVVISSNVFDESTFSPYYVPFFNTYVR